MDTDIDTRPKSLTTPMNSPPKRRESEAKPSRSNQQVLAALPDTGSTSPRKAHVSRLQIKMVMIMQVMMWMEKGLVSRDVDHDP